MTISVIGAGTATREGAEKKKLLPALRKSTRNMLWALDACEAAFAHAKFAPDPRTALVFGSNHGEIETTKDFLMTLANTGVARPALFQNSLHNSTTGFLALQWKLSGPALTVSAGKDTGEETLNTSLTLLRDGSADSAIVVVTDCIPEELHPAFREVYGGKDANEGAAAIVISTKEKADSLGIRPLANFEDQFRFGAAGTSDRTNSLPSSEMGALDAFVQALSVSQRFEWSKT